MTGKRKQLLVKRNAFNHSHPNAMIRRHCPIPIEDESYLDDTWPLAP